MADKTGTQILIVIYPADDPAPDSGRPYFFPPPRHRWEDFLPTLFRALGDLVTMPVHWNPARGQSEAHWIHSCPGCIGKLGVQVSGFIPAEWLFLEGDQPRRPRVCLAVPESNFGDMYGSLRGITFEFSESRTLGKKLSIQPTSLPAPADLPPAFDVVQHVSRRYGRMLDRFPQRLPDELPLEYVARCKALDAERVKEQAAKVAAIEAARNVVVNATVLDENAVAKAKALGLKNMAAALEFRAKQTKQPALPGLDPGPETPASTPPTAAPAPPTADPDEEAHRLRISNEGAQQ